jgi:hypothetical protein
MGDGDEVKKAGREDPRDNDAGLGSREEAYRAQRSTARPALRLVRNEPKPRG